VLARIAQIAVGKSRRRAKHFLQRLFFYWKQTQLPQRVM
jgi:hypothetical protein